MDLKHVGALGALITSTVLMAACRADEQPAANNSEAVVENAASQAPAAAEAAKTESFCGIQNGVAYGNAPAVANASNARVFWTVDTKIHKALAVRLDNSNDRFVIKRDKDPDVVSDNCLYSGQYVRLATAGYLDYLIADTTINGSVVKVGREYGPPQYKGTGTFFIEKTDGSGGVIRFGDSFRIRGTVGNAWLRQDPGGNALIQLNQATNKATAWKFIR
jgi:hypothetical protein